MITDIKDITSFKWATITGVNPLAIKLDGDPAPLALIPESLIDPFFLAVGNRVRVELSLRKVVIHGKSNGGSKTSQGQIPTSVSISGGTASVAADGTVTFSAAPGNVSLNGVFDNVDIETASYRIFGYVQYSADPGGLVVLRLRNAGVDYTAGSIYYWMTQYGIATSWGGLSVTGGVNGGGSTYFPLGFRQFTNFDMTLKHPKSLKNKEYMGLLGSDGTNQVAGTVWGRTAPGFVCDGFTIGPNAGVVTTGWVKVVRIS